MSLARAHRVGRGDRGVRGPIKSPKDLYSFSRPFSFCVLSAFRDFVLCWLRMMKGGGALKPLYLDGTSCNRTPTRPNCVKNTSKSFAWVVWFNWKSLWTLKESWSGGPENTCTIGGFDLHFAINKKKKKKHNFWPHNKSTNLHRESRGIVFKWSKKRWLFGAKCSPFILRSGCGRPGDWYERWIDWVKFSNVFLIERI